MFNSLLTTVFPVLTRYCGCAVTAKALFTMEQPDLVSQYWSCMAASLTHLALNPPENVTEDMSAILCKLTSLQHLGLHADWRSNSGYPDANITLDFPWLEDLVISSFLSTRLKLNCPRLQEFQLVYVQLLSFTGMPSSIREVDLEVAKGSMSLSDMFPAHGAKLLDKLTLGHEEFFLSIDPAIIQELCLNGKLRHLRIDDAASKSFSVGVSWRAVPHTLEVITLELPLDNGIPRILEQLPRLMSLRLPHRSLKPAHLDRPLDPFLDMTRLGKLELVCGETCDELSRGTKCAWTPVALKFIGMAEKRIIQMRLTSPRRSVTFTS